MGEETVIDFKGENFWEILFVDYRWVVVCFFLLPLSFVYNLWFYIRNLIIFKLRSAPKSHSKKVQNIQRQVIVFIEETLVSAHLIYLSTFLGARMEQNVQNTKNVYSSTRLANNEFP